MRRMIKRTEITIETVEITTIRRMPQNAESDAALRNETIHLRPAVCGMTGTVEIPRENGIEEKPEND